MFSRVMSYKLGFSHAGVVLQGYKSDGEHTQSPC